MGEIDKDKLDGMDRAINDIPSTDHAPFPSSIHTWEDLTVPTWGIGGIVNSNSILTSESVQAMFPGFGLIYGFKVTLQCSGGDLTEAEVEINCSECPVFMSDGFSFIPSAGTPFFTDILIQELKVIGSSSSYTISFKAPLTALLIRFATSHANA